MGSYLLLGRLQPPVIPILTSYDLDWRLPIHSTLPVVYVAPEQSGGGVGCHADQKRSLLWLTKLIALPVLHELLANADATESRDSDGVSVLVQVVMVVNRLKPTTLVVVYPDDSKTPVQSVEQQDYLRQSELNH